jgi:hypothetical protein
MPDYQFCRKCDVQRYVDGWITEADYLEAGWRKELEQHITSAGIEFERIQWTCPDCLDLERANEIAWEEERKALADLLGDLKGVVCRRGVRVAERST